jgi:hypothetical protein
MAVLSLSQAQLVGKVSKPTTQLSGKRFSDSVPATGKTYSWLSAKRKRDDDDTGEKSDVILCPRPFFKKVEKLDLAALSEPELTCHSQNYAFLARTDRYRLQNPAQSPKYHIAQTPSLRPNLYFLNQSFYWFCTTFHNQFDFSSLCTNSS